ncbi:MAG: hypothetical protein M3150_02635 [Pseudomonadota bacterium]|nr:hypothetical protein [Pseudomonadota bacterium]
MLSLDGVACSRSWYARCMRAPLTEVLSLVQIVSQSSSGTLLALAFVFSLVVSGVSSLVLADSLEKVGARFRFTEGLLGVVTALGANTPEMSSAITAIAQGQHDLGVGLIIGSNIFNLAALLGLSAVFANGFRIRRSAVILNGSVAFCVTVIGTALVFGVLSAALAILLIALIVIPYIAVSAIRPEQLARWPIPQPLCLLLQRVVADTDRESRTDATPPRASRMESLAIVPAVVSIVGASVVLVQSAVEIGARLALPQAVIGTLVLASLTGLPNLIAALRLALAGRGEAVLSEAFNSNTLNVLAGLCLPALIVGFGSLSRRASFAVWTLLAMTLLLVTVAAIGGRLTRREGVSVVVAYLAFVGLVIVGV